jgi:hypothetical protein
VSRAIAGKTLSRNIARSCIRTGARGRFYNVVDLVNRLETETRNGRQGRIADHLTRMDFIVLDREPPRPSSTDGSSRRHRVRRGPPRPSSVLVTELDCRKRG